MTNRLASLVSWDDIIGMDVDVYFNLHRKLWSVRDRKTRRVVAHLRNVVLTDVKFRVSAAGNARVRSEGRKNVHAFARGTFMGGGGLIPQTLPTEPSDIIEVTYNPYKYTTFVDKATEAPVHEAGAAWLFGRTVLAQPEVAGAARVRNHMRAFFSEPW